MYIEDSQKESNYKALSTGPDPLAEEPEFNLWSDKEKSKFCELYVNSSIMLYDEKIDFDPSYPERIIRKLAKVKYNHPYLEKFKDTDEVVICPCIDISSDTPIDLGVSPIRYKYEQEFLYAFIYDILENSNDEDVCTVNVKALTKVDFRGMKKKRELRDKEQKYKRKQMDKLRKRKQEKEDEEAKQDDTDSDNEEAQNPDLLKKLLSLVSFRGKE
ncbi:uncharacterized protein LOC135841406 [Planococcus citri]|uniref:uncharacterized protein LOC135841406 n=1 Tax=Planococcus citri TaxID=170843 RepID=UPI0031F87536